MTDSTDVDEYLAALPEERRRVMEQLRSIVKDAAPDTAEVIAYKMPAIRLGGRFFLSFDAYKNHYSLFPWTDRMVAELGEAIAPYVKGKGTLQFPANEPLPADLIGQIVAIRLREFA